MSLENHPEKNTAAETAPVRYTNLNISRSNDFTINLVVSLDTAPGGGPSAKQIKLSNEYYNLFVTDNEDFQDNTPFIVPHEHLLQKEMDADLTLKYASLSATAIEEIKTFPCLFAKKNTAFAHTDENHTMKFGFIRQIEILRTGIKIYPEFINPQPRIYQQRVNENLEAFDLWGHEQANELDDIHWSIKKVNLTDVLIKLQFLDIDFQE